MENSKELSEIDINSLATNFDNKAVLTPELISDRRKRIVDLEKGMKLLNESYDMVQFNEGKINHHFGTGTYVRELFIPAGNVIVSKIHKGKTVNTIATGKITVICPHKGINTYIAPIVFVSEPYTKRVVIAHEDTLWITSHENPNNTTNLEEVEENIIAKDFEDNLLNYEEEL